MESIDDIWVVNSDSVTSSFRINHIAGRPLGCNEREDYIYTKLCGFGWRFAIRYDTSSPEIDVYCDFQKVDVTFESIKIRAYLGTLESNESVFKDKRDFDKLSSGLHLLKSWKPSDVIDHERLSFVVTFTPPQIPQLIGRASSGKQTNNALRNSIRSGSFIDTRFVVFSTRISAQIVGRPQAVFANSAVLQGRSLPLDAYLSKVPTPDSANQEEIYIDDYEYESDSDLGDTDDSTGEFEGNVPTSQPNNPPAYIMDTDRVVVVRDAAFTTWQALVYYMYTGDITFATLKSGPVHAKDELSKDKYQCSPKSMYRLADKFGLGDLKAAAIKNIASQITATNVLDEYFSRFTSRYPEILAMETDIMRKHRTSPEVVAKIEKKMASIAAGELPYCAEMLVVLFKLSD